MGECIFCKIINKEIPAKIVFEDDDVLALHDIHPLAPVHVLIIPKKHIPTIDDLTEEDKDLMGKMILIAQKIARDLRTAENGYKLLFRVKGWGEQEVDHIHLHLIGGAKLKEGIGPA